MVYLGVTAGYGAAHLQDFVGETEVIGKDQGPLYGLYLGYLYRFNERIAAGVEVDYIRTHFKDTVEVDPQYEPGLLEKLKSNWTASVRGRAGIFLAEPLFAYGTAGIAFSDVGDPGPVFGGGLELAVTQRVMVRAELLRYDFQGGDNDQTVGRLGLGIRLN